MDEGREEEKVVADRKIIFSILYVIPNKWNTEIIHNYHSFI